MFYFLFVRIRDDSLNIYFFYTFVFFIFTISFFILNFLRIIILYFSSRKVTITRIKCRYS